MRKIKRVYILILLLSTVFAQDYASYAGSFLRSGTGARSIALGSALTAGNDTGFPAYFNPASIAGVDKRQAFFTHHFLSLDRHKSIMSFTTPLPPVGGLSVGWVGSGIGNIDGRTLSGVQTDILSAGEDAIFFSFGISPVNKFSIGGTVKILRNRLPNIEGDITGNGVGFDFGILYNINNNINLALVVKDVKSAYQWSNKLTSELGRVYQDEFPMIVRGGVKIQYQSILIVGDIGAYTVGSDFLGTDYRFGAEYVLVDKYFLRAGWQNDRPAFGIGLKYSIAPKFPSYFDYAIVIEPIGGTTQVISYALHF